MWLQGPLATLLVNLALEVYGPYLKKDKHGHPVLYIHILNAMYGIMKVVLLYYQCFMADIQGISFKLNPYDPCVANKLVDGKELTLVWHVDDIKASHCSKQVVSNYIEWLHKTYKCIFEDRSGALKISWGLMHDYLGMQLDFSILGKLKLTMVPYVRPCLLSSTSMTRQAPQPKLQQHCIFSRSTMKQLPFPIMQQQSFTLSWLKHYF